MKLVKVSLSTYSGFRVDVITGLKQTKKSYKAAGFRISKSKLLKVDSIPYNHINSTRPLLNYHIYCYYTEKSIQEAKKKLIETLGNRIKELNKGAEYLNERLEVIKINNPVK